MRLRDLEINIDDLSIEMHLVTLHVIERAANLAWNGPKLIWEMNEVHLTLHGLKTGLSKVASPGNHLTQVLAETCA